MSEIAEDDLNVVIRGEAEDVFLEGSSHYPEVMAAVPHSPGGPNGIIRSQSFAGFSTLQEKRSRCNSFIGNSLVLKKPQAKPKKTQLSGHKGGSNSSREPQPKRVEEVYRALKQGLVEYLEVHQVELDKLTSLTKDMQRNSRLGVLYDLDKQIKTLERYIRRLEFHMSKVDELYEAFCIQRHLRDGACKMKQAFSTSHSSRSSRESLAEVNRRYKEYSENMSTFESELENLLGEFHIKMRGLAGFARLCSGDQYEVFMRYGRQRWKLKGRIEGNSRQSWDGEEMVFTPLIIDLISIKVSELKGLANHILVGSVICETKDLFTAMPQLVAVDVNDLGTIKLNLEVAWYPFDAEDLTLSSGNLSKAAALQRRVSVYSQDTPETPIFQESPYFSWHTPQQDGQHPSFLHTLRDTFLQKMRRSRSLADLPTLRMRPTSSLEVYSTLPDDVFENGGCGVTECKQLFFTFSDTPQSSPLTLPGRPNPAIMVTPPENDCQSLQSESMEDGRPQRDGDEEDGVEEEDEEEEEEGSISISLASEADGEWEEQAESLQNGSASQGSDRLSTTDVFLDHVVSDALLQDEGSDLKPVELEAEEGNLTKQLVRRLTSGDVLLDPARPEGALGWGSSLEEAFHGLLLTLEGLQEKSKELQELEQEVLHLEDVLKSRAPAHRSRSSSLSLTVESALESFDFLNTSDFDDDDTGDDDLPNSGFFSTESERIGAGQHPEARGHLSEALTEDTGMGNSVAGTPLPLTTGSESLDIAVTRHLQYCCHLIQLLSSGGSPSHVRAQLHKISSQSQLLEELGEICTDRLGTICTPADVLPGLAERPALLLFWSQLSGPGSPFHSTLDRALKHLQHNYTEVLQEKHLKSADTVFRLVISEMVDRSELASPCPSPSALYQDVLTVFQFHNYVCAHDVHSMEEHFLQVAREVDFVAGLRSGDPVWTLRELQEVQASSLWPQEETLRALATLLVADDPQLRQSVATFLTSAATHSSFRAKAVDCYIQALSEAGVQTQREACVALGCLQASEGIEAVVSLCNSADEELRQVAIETLLTFGEEGQLAYEQLDTVPREMVHLGSRRGNAITTAL
ncbi:rho family-interacting cell polarization regulator 2-like [Megalops cyprinoides]|uniref:rho family-interacting cell polarization regulator 2-like n=1 Tax=Megalops cyprinoides TaxID=118141 RepID=UPI001863BE29|nr:rho family-interacting cell polarization regulator 2-like [Megalops cyprinoides]